MKKNFFRELFFRYFNQDLDIDIQSFNLLAFSGIVSSAIISLFSGIMKMGAVNTWINLSLSALGCGLLYFAEKKKCYLLCSRIIVIAVFITAFPLLFFAVGGYRSGTPSLFILAMVYTAILVKGRERIVMIAVESALYAACFLTAYYLPQSIIVMPVEHGIFLDVMIGSVVSGMMLLVITMLRADMFRRKQLQIEELNFELMARNETLSQYDRMKSDFLATVAHEINTPLAIIYASSIDTLELLDETPMNQSEIMNNQQHIINRVKLIDGIILDLMDTVAIESGRLSLHRQQVDLNKLIRAVCDVQFTQLDTNNNQIGYQLQGGLQMVWADPVRIEQMMTNLLSNAIAHTKDGLITVRLEGAEGRQVIQVEDTGEGMTRNQVRDVLKRYVSTKEDYWRHGIGLYICRRIMQAHGGEIWIDSKVGYGTTVSFALFEGQHDDRMETFTPTRGR